jgi:hypothetical protein
MHKVQTGGDRPRVAQGSKPASFALDAFATTTLMSRCPSEIRALACWVPAFKASPDKPGPVKQPKTLVFLGTAEGTVLV